VNATAALTVVPSTETFGLPEQVPHRIAKLRLVPPEVLATIMHQDQDLTA
jgi:hypothetical protein